MIVIFHITNRLACQGDESGMVKRARLSSWPSIEIGLVTSAPAAAAAKTGAAISVALKAVKPNCSCRAWAKSSSKMRITTCIFGLSARALSAICKFIASCWLAKDDRTRVLDIGAFQRAGLSRVRLDDRNTQVAGCRGGMRVRVDFNDGNLFTHLVQPLGDTISQMTQVRSERCDYS